MRVHPPRKIIYFSPGDTVLFTWEHKRYKGNFCQYFGERFLVTTINASRLRVTKVGTFYTKMVLIEKKIFYEKTF